MSSSSGSGLKGQSGASGVPLPDSKPTGKVFGKNDFKKEILISDPPLNVTGMNVFQLLFLYLYLLNVTDDEGCEVCFLGLGEL